MLVKLVNKLTSFAKMDDETNQFDQDALWLCLQLALTWDQIGSSVNQDTVRLHLATSTDFSIWITDWIGLSRAIFK